jgi:hypothetical protein
MATLSVPLRAEFDRQPAGEVVMRDRGMVREPSEDHAATTDSRREPRSSSAPGVSLSGIEILAKSIYRELCNRGCRRSDVIRLATALLDQLVTRKIEHGVVVEAVAPNKHGFSR